MKSINIIFLVILNLLSGEIQARQDSTSMLMLCRDISMGLQMEYLARERELPISLSEINLLQEIVSREPRYGELLNRLAVVPEAPRLGVADNISRDHLAQRIFAIERGKNADYASRSEATPVQEGRYSIWISEDGRYAASAWIKEAEAQAIFRQLGSFDPTSQPLAFPNAERRVARDKEEKDRKKKERAEFYKVNLNPEMQRPDKSKGIGTGLNGGKPTSAWALWLTLLIPVLAGLWWLFRGRRGTR